MPGKGILVVELKGWREENILRVENNEAVIIRTADGEVAASPQKQARGYRFLLNGTSGKPSENFLLYTKWLVYPKSPGSFLEPVVWM